MTFYRVHHWWSCQHEGRPAHVACDRKDADKIVISTGGYFAEIEFAKVPGADDYPLAAVRLISMLNAAYKSGQHAAKVEIRTALGI